MVMGIARMGPGVLGSPIRNWKLENFERENKEYNKCTHIVLYAALALTTETPERSPGINPGYAYAWFVIFYFIAPGILWNVGIFSFSFFFSQSVSVHQYKLPRRWTAWTNFFHCFLSPQPLSDNFFEKVWTDSNPASHQL